MANDPIRDAVQLIGDNQPNDYALKPTGHPQYFKSQPETSVLCDILTSSKVASLARQYDEKDSDAAGAQKDFKRTFDLSNVMVLTTSLLISATLAVSIVFPGNQPALLVVSVASLISGAVAAIFLNILRQGDLLDGWLTERARAELMRSEYFLEVASTDVPDDPDHRPDLLRLEYFRRYQLGIQRNFYHGRSREHSRQSRRALTISSISIALASLVTALSGTALSGFAHGKFTALAAFGAAFTAFGSFATLRENVYQNQRNAERYKKTAETLTGMESTLDEVRKAVREAGQLPLLEFVKAVQSQLSLEHQQWLELKDPQNKAIDELKANLDEATRKAGEKKKAAAASETP
ncbi:MAG TPA: hypothetical protein VE961_05320 [Pyrinomonadaceae bacterium]|nr:hypothetical protein [Pyrinomonadaceae bacterium]